MIFYYHLFIGEVKTIRNETTYPIHGKYPLNLLMTKTGNEPKDPAQRIFSVDSW